MPITDVSGVKYGSAVQRVIQLIFLSGRNFFMVLPVDQAKSRRIQAVPQTGWFGSVVKYMAKMATTTPAMHFRAFH